jgi:hypothetical protein
MHKNFQLFGFIFLLGLTTIAYSGPSKIRNLSDSNDPELVEECKKAGGVARVFSSTCTDTCGDYVLKQRKGPTRSCGMMVTADCDCGPDQCFHKGKCWKNEDGATAWKKQEAELRSEVFIQQTSSNLDFVRGLRIAEAVKKVGKSFKPCFVQSLKENKRSFDQISVTWCFDSTRRAKNLRTNLKNPKNKLAKCVIQKIETIQFQDAPEDSTSQITMEFIYAPATRGN